jgi:hypothetical protein
VSEADDTQQASGRAASMPESDLDDIPRLGFFQLVPKRSLVKIAMLLFMLAGIIFIQSRSSTLIKRITDVVMPAPPPAGGAPPPVRLAPTEPSRP